MPLSSAGERAKSKYREICRLFTDATTGSPGSGVTIDGDGNLISEPVFARPYLHRSVTVVAASGGVQLQHCTDEDPTDGSATWLDVGSVMTQGFHNLSATPMYWVRFKRPAANAGTEVTVVLQQAEQVRM